MSNMRGKQLHRNQSGLMSFVVAVIIMVLLSLIVLAFGRLVRREQRQTLDRQLNTQAFYAAESAVNDTIHALKKYPVLLADNYDTCTGANSFVTKANNLEANIVNPNVDGVIGYSCLLVNNTLPELNYKQIGIGQSTTIPINTASGNISTLEISWEDTATKTPDLTGCPNLYPTLYPDNYPATCQIGVLRLELVPFTGPRSRDQLIQQRAITFLSPQASGGDPDLLFTGASVDNQGYRQFADCDGAPGPRRCTLRITMDGGAAGMSTGYLRLRSVYRPTEVTIRAYDASNAQLGLTGAQVEIDVTGRANDILKRIKVARPLGEDGDLFPEFALQSKSTQCKRMAVSPPNIVSVDTSGVAASQQAYCDPNQP